MSHTMHRKGSPASFGQDCVIFAMTAKGFNEKNSRHALQEFLRILQRYNVANLGDMKTGGMYLVDKNEILKNVQDTSIVHAVFTDPNEVASALRELREAELGVSVNVTGIVAHVDELSRQAGIERHTVEYSLGIQGRLDLLPEEELLEITTMCGHGMVSQHLVRKQLIDIKRGRITPERAAELLATPCVCGVFNPRRAAALLRELAALWCLDES